VSLTETVQNRPFVRHGHAIRIAHVSSQHSFWVAKGLSGRSVVSVWKRLGVLL